MCVCLVSYCHLSVCVSAVPLVISDAAGVLCAGWCYFIGWFEQMIGSCSSANMFSGFMFIHVGALQMSAQRA